MTRVALLRAGYAALALSFAALAASAWAGAFLLPALACAVIGAILLALTRDDVPRWAGVALLLYFALIIVAFVLATPITVRKGGSFGLEPPHPQLMSDVFYYLALASPLMIAGASLAASWEREHAPRILLAGALAGFVIVAVLSIVLEPRGVDEETIAQSARSQGDLAMVLFALAAASGAAGTAWSAVRAEEYA